MHTTGSPPWKREPSRMEQQQHVTEEGGVASRRCTSTQTSWRRVCESETLILESVSHVSASHRAINWLKLVKSGQLVNEAVNSGQILVNFVKMVK